MEKLQQVLMILNRMESPSAEVLYLQRVDARAKWIVTLLFLVAMLSLPVTHLVSLLLFGIYPLVGCALAGLSYEKLFLHSCMVLPFVLLVGAFNPWYQREPAFYVGQIAVSVGWVSLFSLVVRSLFSVQAVLLLVRSTGFYRLCRALQRLGVPSFFAAQLLFVYRYLFVLLQELLSMLRAYQSRSFGRRHFPVKQWGQLMGQLMIRTFQRSGHIHRSMLARGFDGGIQVLDRFRWSVRDTVFVLTAVAVFLVLRLFSFSALFSSVIFIQ